jgi:hypothetical protein
MEMMNGVSKYQTGQGPGQRTLNTPAATFPMSSVAYIH